MATAWQRAIATAKLFLAVHGASTASEHEAAKYVKNLSTYERQRLEQQLRGNGDDDAAAWISKNS